MRLALASVSSFLAAASGTVPSFPAQLIADHQSKMQRQGQEHGPANRRRRSAASFPISHLGILNAGLLDHQIQICNAYCRKAEMDVEQESAGKVSKLTASPIGYKTCTSMNLTLHNGDRLHFTHSDTGVNQGTFKVSRIPNTEAILLLVLRRKQPGLNTLAFESHVFANQVNAQIAVLDMYQGRRVAKLHIEEKSNEKVIHSENLRFNSVVAINSGQYLVVMQDEDGKIATEALLPAHNQGNYVIMRVGNEDLNDPMDLLVFPQIFKSLAAKRSQPPMLAFCLPLLALQIIRM